ncbi:DUF397 domain-containing protein [Streptomyces sp. MnatMP-M17]|uniref:DUF397 domain-containing protein n=1 Tax=unclassified Streptomyces TaxID=2593676 RepID=UPI00081D8821|nr:DUF397 domain-containing protein [Streptomyces sp. MnatMP-M17]MYZ39366.1 DUF397 domain-containing protein [Streptomyces sp. SID4917]SCG03468.1 protein of unknown function [Streptomyces sp. MnatMP-M17]
MTREVVGPYRTSSYSGQNNNCVEVALTADGGRAVRDTKDRTRPSLHFGPAAWRMFLVGAAQSRRI